jgi:glycyl-tRNA synthetase beta chain
MESLLIEIGTEEIPAGYINPALKAFSSTLLQKLSEARIEHGTARNYGTPRRLAVQVDNVAAQQKSMRSEAIGPPAKIGFDEHGRPTVAAKKFAEKMGISVSKLAIKETEKGAYLCAEKKERGLATRTLLKEIIPEVILSIPFPKKMKWADLDIEFARPIHSILALLGKNVISFALGNLKSGRYTYGHHFMAPGKIKVTIADEYVDILRSAFVLVDMQERKDILIGDIAKVAKKLGGHILPDDELVDIVNNLVEYPVAVAGKFDDAFLEVPDAVLINAMREHQKYFSVIDSENQLMPCFIAVNNTAAKNMDLVARGHERVLRARLADAQFFFRGDLEIPNEGRVEKLKGVLFQAQLGSMHEKIERVRKIAEYLVDTLDDGLLSKNEGTDLKKQVSRAAKLCKSDLVSQVVIEFPKLQGIMGRIYAELSGETPTVAASIEEHYRPVYSGAPLPQTDAGAILSIADKIDSICGCFSVGLVPTGASDPYALRRQGIGIVQIMLERGFSLSLSQLIEKSLSLFNRRSAREIVDLSQNIYTFLKNRISHQLAEEGFSKDVIAAVVSVSADDIPDIWHKVATLESLKAQPDFEPLAVAFKRVVNIMKKSGKLETVGPPGVVNQTLFEHESETALFEIYKKVKNEVSVAMDKGLFDKALHEIASLREPVDAFFDGVMVMTETMKLRHNRLNLLGCVADLFGKFADFSKIST